MRTGLVVAGAAAVAAALGVVVWKSRKKAPPPPAVAPTSERAADGVVAAAVVPAANAGTPPPMPATGKDILGGLTDKVGGGALGTAASTIAVGLQVADVTRQVMTKVGGEGVGNLSVINPAFALGFAAKVGAEKLGAKIGIPSEVNRRIAQTVGVAAGAPALLPFKVTAEAVSLGIRVVGGAKAERDVRDVFKKVDPSNHKNVTAKPIAAVAKGVSAVANVFKGGLFGKKK